MPLPLLLLQILTYRRLCPQTAAAMRATMLCIRLTRSLILLLTTSFIALSSVQLLMNHSELISWPKYPNIVAILLDLVLFIGLIASLTQHLKTLIFFSWLIALTFLLIFFGNTVSSQYQSDLLGMLYLLLICILAFTYAILLIKSRMPCEEAHHPFKCSQQQLFEQADSLPIPLPPHLQHHSQPASTKMSPSSPLPPPPPLNSHCYAAKNDPQF